MNRLNSTMPPPVMQRIKLQNLPLSSEFLTEKRYEDERGTAHLILNGREVRRLGFLSLNPGTGYRGAHVHRIKNEGLYVVEGRAEVELVCAISGERATLELGPGDRLDLPPDIAHRIKALSPLCFVEYADRPYEQEDDIPFTF
jgi:L-fuculose-phosphate aldolase